MRDWRLHRRDLLFVLIVVVLGIVCGVATCRCARCEDEVEKLKPIAEKTREHCLLMMTMLRHFEQGLDLPALHKTTQRGIDALIDSSEPVDMCLDARSERLMDPLTCMLHGEDDKCRRDFVKRLLEAMPERYKSFAPLE